jgi:putative multicomponent Na+:H+ antiporter subunit B
MTDFYVYAIVAILPLAAILVVTQTNPYHALIMRGILGAIAALMYSILGAPDVALTEALVGTLLAITLYAVAVRSSLVLRIGRLNPLEKTDEKFDELMEELKTVFNAHYVRIELVDYADRESLQQALVEKEIHATITLEKLEDLNLSNSEIPAAVTESKIYHTVTRLQRIRDIIRTELKSSLIALSYTNLEEVKS